MSGQDSSGGRTSPSDGFAYDPATQPDLFDRILSRRIIAFFIDAIIIVALMIAGTIPVEIDDAWLWALLALYAAAMVMPGHGRPWNRD